MREVPPTETAASTETRSEFDQLTSIKMNSEMNMSAAGTQETPWMGAHSNNFVIEYSDESVREEIQSQQRRAQQFVNATLSNIGRQVSNGKDSYGLESSSGVYMNYTVRSSHDMGSQSSEKTANNTNCILLTSMNDN